MNGGEDMPTNTDLSVKLIEEMSGVRGDIREIMATMRHFDSKLDRVNDDIKEIKSLASEASSQAESADAKAQKALDALVIHRERIDGLNRKINKTADDQKVHKRWIVSTAVPVMAIVVSILITIFA